MSTSIWSANIIIGNDTNQVILEKIAIKRLPVELLLSDTNFIQRLKKLVGDEKKWNKLPTTDGLPKLKVFYLKCLGEVAEEPLINE